MIKFSLNTGRVFCGLTIVLVCALAILPGCKKKEQPEDVEPVNVTDSIQDMPEPVQAVQEDIAEKINLRILYVGLSNTDRQKDFISFLSENFKEVKTIDLWSFKEEQTEDSDVVILDKDGIQWGSEGGKPLWDLKVSKQYSRPTISLGIPGAFWTDQMGLKTGYM